MASVMICCATASALLPSAVRQPVTASMAEATSMAMAAPADPAANHAGSRSIVSRRGLLGTAASSMVAASLAVAAPPAAFAYPLIQEASDRGEDLLDELPPKAKQAYLQYLPQLQLDGDYFAFELTPLLAQPGRWDKIFALTESTNIGSAQSVSRLDREFITPMRILALAFPPDLGGEDMQSAIDNFQKSMFRLSSLARKNAMTGNVAAPNAAEIKEVETAFDGGRKALNAFYEAVNTGAGAARLTPIPPIPQMMKGEGYPRSKTLYTQLLKDAALCRNRGGEQLAGLWGNLMVYGTIPGVNPCGDAAAKYYMQGNVK
jgi:hypothetical protein